MNRALVPSLSLVLIAACGESEAPTPTTPPERLAIDDPPGARRDLIDELIEARDAKRHPGDGGGTAVLLEPASGEVVASSRREFLIEFTAGPEGIAEGGQVQLIPSPFWGWSTPQTSTPARAGYSTVESPDDVPFTVEAGGWLGVRIGRGGMSPGQRLRIRYGAEGGAFVDRYAEAASRLWIGVDADGDGFRAVIDESPTVRVVAGPPARLAVFVPATAKSGSDVPVTVSVLDRLGNFAAQTSGSLTVGWEGGETIDRELEAGRLRERLLPADGINRVVASLDLPDGQILTGRSNPLLVESKGATILMADFHGHTQLSDGTGTVEDYYRYARDVAALDVVALTDHDHWGMQPLDASPSRVDSIREVARSFHAPGEFVSLFGYEWTNWIHGHRHVVEFGSELPWLSSLVSKYDEPGELWAALEGLDALTFAHHSAGDPIPVNWDFAPPREIEPVTELASIHGSSEAPDAPLVLRRPRVGNFVRDALDRGYDLGFVGSGDSHDGHPGLPHLANPNGGGLACVIAGGRTKSDVLKALRARRCYATNGPRMIVRAALGPFPMGSDVPVDGSSLSLYLRVVGTGPLDRIELIRKGQPVAVFGIGNGAEEFEGSFEVNAPVAGDYVYVRVHQREFGCAWTSPFFLKESPTRSGEPPPPPSER